MLVSPFRLVMDVSDPTASLDRIRFTNAMGTGEIVNKVVRDSQGNETVFSTWIMMTTSYGGVWDSSAKNTDQTGTSTFSFEVGDATAGEATTIQIKISIKAVSI